LRFTAAAAKNEGADFLMAPSTIKTIELMELAMESAFLDGKDPLSLSVLMNSGSRFGPETIREMAAKGRVHCPGCGKPVHLVSRKGNVATGHTYYFAHFSGQGNSCEFAASSQAGSRAGVHGGVQEGIRHMNAKIRLAATLRQLDDWDGVAVEKTVFSDHPADENRQRRRPDVFGRYKGKDIAFEIQNHSEALAMMLERREFYRQKGTPLVWVSLNPLLDDMVELRQLHKDIMHLQHGTVLVFEEDEANLSLENGSLMFSGWEVVPRENGIDIVDDLIPFTAMFDDLHTQPGLVYLNDRYAEFTELERIRLERLKHRCQLEAEKLLRPGNGSIYERAHFYRAINSSPIIDSAWLESLYQYFVRCRMAGARKYIVDLCIEFDEFDMSETGKNKERVEAVFKRISRYGIPDCWWTDRGLSLWTIQRLLAIVGMPVATKQKGQNHIQAQRLVGFMNSEASVRLLPAAMAAARLSPFTCEILAAPAIQRRGIKSFDFDLPANSESAPYVGFLEWFCSDGLLDMDADEVHIRPIPEWLEHYRGNKFDDGFVLTG
jgi:hypothetical protein